LLFFLLHYTCLVGAAVVRLSVCHIQCGEMAKRTIKLFHLIPVAVIV